MLLEEEEEHLNQSCGLVLPTECKEHDAIVEGLSFRQMEANAFCDGSFANAGYT